MYFALATVLIFLPFSVSSLGNFVLPGRLVVDVARPRDSHIPLAEAIFIDAFTQRVHASETLTRLMDFCNVTGLEYSESVYQ
ncbi:hypothetical protein TNCT_400161 [Trichonephila clavata]|uniref:Uncharacterized protein n=1 Tax=Trichonephila clavata TaxID=2740835 RepID=A0A8X6LYG1_TRICU|nr:hypothetical protein TNCT_400161 [Trichonephila clavata]